MMQPQNQPMAGPQQDQAAPPDEASIKAHIDEILSAHPELAQHLHESIAKAEQDGVFESMSPEEMQQAMGLLQQVVDQPENYTQTLQQLIRMGADPADFPPANTPPEELKQGIAKHNVYQWDLVFTNNDLFKGGWAGQGLLVNPDRDLVAVYVGYFNEDQSELSVLPRLRQVLNGVFGEVIPAE